MGSFSAFHWMTKRYKARLAAGTMVQSVTENLEGSDISAPSPSVESFGEETAEELNLESEEEFPPLSQVNRLNQTSLYPKVQVTRNPTVRDSQSTPLIGLGDVSPSRVISPIVPGNDEKVIGSIQDPEPTGARPGEVKVGPPIPQTGDDFVQPRTNWSKPTDRANRSEVQIREKKQTVTKSHSFHQTENV